MTQCSLPAGGTDTALWQWRTEGGFNPPPQIPKVLQNRAKLNPIWKPLKIAEFGTPTLQYVRKKGSKILKLPWFAIVLH